MPVPPDIYENDVDFTTLALRYPDFAKKLKTNRQLDFSDPESVRQLTKALLHRDFNLSISLPEDRLCPPVPNRFNYILFVQKLLDSTHDTYGDKHDPSRRVIGLDIGTGASAIYPLLACRQRESWLFLATEIDDKSRSFAARNINENDLGSRIKIINTDAQSKVIIPSSELERFERIDILLTNPPFYASETELQALAKQKAHPPNSACTGAPVEMICSGGEVSFVSQLVYESSLPQNKFRIQWFSSMLGKLGSVTTVIDKLKGSGCTNYAVTEFVQGQKTRRWCVAWSWFGLRPSNMVARGTEAVDKKYLPFPTELDIPANTVIHNVARVLNEEITSVPGIEWQWRDGLHTGVARSMDGDVWSRRARRKQKIAAKQKEDSMDLDRPGEHTRKAERDTVGTVPSNDDDDNEDCDPEFAFKITLRTPYSKTMTDITDSDGTSVKLRWLQGSDSTVFESFHGWLKRKLTQ